MQRRAIVAIVLNHDASIVVAAVGKRHVLGQTLVIEHVVLAYIKLW